MDERHRNEPTTPTETTRRQLLTALTAGLLALLGFGATTSQSAAKRKNKRTARLVPLPR
jgi:hypothetical protein